MGIQGKLRAEKVVVDKRNKGKKNPLTNKTAMQILNPAAKQMREAEVKALAARKVTRVAALTEALQGRPQGEGRALRSLQRRRDWSRGRLQGCPPGHCR